jgi:isoquinoline 1-oxidoreductase subunit beta
MGHKNQSARGISRRQFVGNSLSVTFSVGALGLLGACSREQPTITTPIQSGPSSPNAWVTIYPDNRIKIMYGGTEMGQGSSTATPMVLAEHLDANWELVEVETVAVNNPVYGVSKYGNALYSAGSITVSDYFERMRQAGSQVRNMLLQAVAAQWNIPLQELTTEPSLVLHKRSGRQISYGKIVATLPLPEQADEVDPASYKSPADYRYLGRNFTRYDVAAKVNGSARYGIDVQVPDMLYASVLRSPVEGESPLAIDDRNSLAVAGVVEIVSLPDAVAVVANTLEASIWGKQRLEVTWSSNSSFASASTAGALEEYTQAVSNPDSSAVVWSETGNVDEALASAERVVEARYTSDPVYHAQMEPLSATASVSADGKNAEIWVGTQTQTYTIVAAAKLLGTSEDNITLHPMTIGGGFGRRLPLHQLNIEDALRISRAVGKPVKVIYSREDDLAADIFRPSAAQLLRAGLNGDGKLIGLKHRLAGPSVLGYMNEISARWLKGRDPVSMEGTQNEAYDIPHHRAEHIHRQRQSRVGTLRGVATGYTNFAVESFLDELAADQQLDPLQFRLQLSHEHPRVQTVLKTVAQMAQWDKPRPAGIALGLAFSIYKKSLSAGIAEISFDQEQHKITVHRFWSVGDPGFVVSPDNAAAQLEGNIVMGISAALKEQITIEAGRVQQSNFHNYPIMRMSELPEILTRVISSEHPPTGVGELGFGTTGAAIGNALFRLTGKRIRHLPMTPGNLQARLEQLG